MTRPILLTYRNQMVTSNWKELLEEMGYKEVEAFDSPDATILFLSELDQTERNIWLNEGFFVVGFNFDHPWANGDVLVEYLEEQGVPTCNIVRISVLDRQSLEIGDRSFIQISNRSVPQTIEEIRKLAEDE